MSRSDAELLVALRGGDRAALEELLARHEQRIYRFGLRMCGDEEAAREVLQETLVAAFRNLPSFRGDAALSTWLYQIARSFCIKARRRAPAARLDEVHEPPAASPGPEATVHAHEIGAALAAAIAGLSPEQREVVVLRDVEGLSAEDAAAIVGVDVGALKSRLHRARAELRKNLVALLADGDGDAPRCPGLAAELAAEIDHATCARIEAHLSRCARCAGAPERLRRSVSLCQQIPGDEVPAAVRAAVRCGLR